MLKRIMTTVIGVFVIVAVFFLDSLEIVGGPIFFNMALAVISFMMMFEFYHAVEKKGVKPMKSIGYVTVIVVLLIGMVKAQTITLLFFMLVPLLIFAGFVKSIRTNIEYTILDIAVTVFAPLYITFTLSFMGHTRAMENGVWYIWYILGGAWLTDCFAFLIGRTFGKHKLKKISTNKSWEGCIAGVVGCVAFFLIYTAVLQALHVAELNYLIMGMLGLLVSIISQVGDIAASSIKRYCNLKDFSNLMPGHGGLLDRFDSVIFVAPLVYLALSFIV